MAGKPKKRAPTMQEGSGRPSLFTPERREAILDAIRHRVPYELAANANGICEETLYAWIRQGIAERKEGKLTEHAVFSESIKKAEMVKMREHLDIIAERPERWQADAWILERRWYKYFGPNAQLNELNKRLSKLEEGEISNEERNEEET